MKVFIVGGAQLTMTFMKERFNSIRSASANVFHYTCKKQAPGLSMQILFFREGKAGLQKRA